MKTKKKAVATAAAASGETILVVDDEATIRHLIDEVLGEDEPIIAFHLADVAKEAGATIIDLVQTEIAAINEFGARNRVGRRLGN